jgi:hypothetical protein
LSIRGGGVSSGFAIPIFGCIYTNACATSDVIRFPKDTEKIEIGFSLSAFSESTGRPVIHDYYANLRMGVAEFCEVDGVFKTCAVPYDSASNRWLQNVVPLPVPVPVPSAIVLLAGGLAGLAVVARRRRPSQGLPIR